MRKKLGSSHNKEHSLHIPENLIQDESGPIGGLEREVKGDDEDGSEGDNGAITKGAMMGMMKRTMIETMKLTSSDSCLPISSVELHARPFA